MRQHASEHKPDVVIRTRLCVSEAVLCNCAADYSSFRPFGVVINFLIFAYYGHFMSFYVLFQISLGVLGSHFTVTRKLFSGSAFSYFISASLPFLLQFYCWVYRLNCRFRPIT